MLLNELESRQVVALSESGLGAVDIAKSLSIDEELVRLTLNANKAGAPEDRDINDSQLALLRRRAYDLAFSEDDSVSARMAMFLIERDKPRLNKEPLNTVTLINQAIINAQGRFAELTDKYKE